MGKRLTILDVARLAGVSKATVSRVLNGNPQVDPQLRERVLRVVEEHNFVPSINAVALNGRSQLLGILMPRYLWVALQEITWTIADYVGKYTNYEIILYSCSNEEGYSKVIDQIIKTNLVAGVIATTYDQSPDYLVKLYADGLPVVLVDTIGTTSELPAIGAQHRSGAYQAIRYLLELGHRRIAYINGPAHLLCSRERYQGYCDALHEFGLQADPTLFQQGLFEPTSGKEAAQTLLSLEQPPTAIFATNDDMAYATIQTIQERRLHVPEDISVIGFNDDPSPLVRTSLTTIHQPFAQMARCAIEILISMLQPDHVFSDEWQQIVATVLPDAKMQKREDLTMPFQINLPTHLIIRNTCSAPRSISLS